MATLSAFAGSAADAAGRATGRFLASLPLVPGLAGAAVFSLGIGEIAGHLLGRGLTPWVALTVGGAFALWLDRKI